MIIVHCNLRYVSTACLLVGALLISPPLLSGQTQTLHTSSAIYPQTQLLRLESSDQWSFQIGERETPIAGSLIVRWGSWRGLRDEPGVWLRDGSWLCGEISIAGESISVASDWFKSQSLSLRNLRGLVLAPPTTLSRWLELESQMQAASGEQDLLWLAGGKKLSGIIRWPADDGELTASKIEVDTSGKSVELALEEVEAMVFSPTLSGVLLPHKNALQIGLVDGSLLWVASLKPDVSHVELTLDGAQPLLTLDGPRQFCKAINYLASGAEPPAVENKLSVGQQFLSDMAVASYRHLSDSTLVWELGINRDLYGRALHTRDGVFSQGLATHSTSQVAFRWDGAAGRLLAEVTLAAPPPQAAPGHGSVNCQVLLARGGKLETADSFSLNRNSTNDSTAVHLLDVDVSQAQLVVLVTDKGDFGQYGDQALWLDARIAQPLP